ncbi:MULTISPECIES: caspase domain-containing protein [unclassified Mesorhizobium]|uniref:caspase family protein n=1 Tax=unclassified Mesorhizobium TaxID=325217 RepID=UPI0024152220|nr:MULTISPECIES: caspase domain-containing protein [unclassified Mesorhizobium]MDG4853323.1 caspase domain-containing protein [Mesorhizobium sp. WSM4982]MDG4913291.1 caspase domain-containing protein [Mesorhizobium sp. WSM4983]
MSKVCLLCACLLLLAGLSTPASSETQIGQRSHRYALVIGNSAYRFASSLPNGVNDANAISRVLQETGFDVTLGLDTDASTFRALIGKFRRNLRPGDVSLFYFAGHGLQANGENYLLPVDAALQRPADLALEAERLQDIIAAMTAEENIAIVLLDACRDNPFVKQLSGPGQSRGLAIAKGLGALDAGRGVFIGFATQPGNVALDGAVNHSPFADSLVKRIKTPSIDIEILMRRVRLDVMNATSGKQVPWSNSSLVEPGFSFNPDAASSPSSADTYQPDTNAAAELEFWKSIKDTSDVSMYRAYLAAFPNGAFVEIAKSRIAKFQAPTPPRKKILPKKVSRKPQVSLPVDEPSNRSAKTSAPAKPETVGRCRDGNKERCRQRCREGARRACRKLQQLGG